MEVIDGPSSRCSYLHPAQWTRAIWRVMRNPLAACTTWSAMLKVGAASQAASHLRRRILLRVSGADTLTDRPSVEM